MLSPARASQAYRADIVARIKEAFGIDQIAVSFRMFHHQDGVSSVRHRSSGHDLDALAVLDYLVAGSPARISPVTRTRPGKFDRAYRVAVAHRSRRMADTADPLGSAEPEHVPHAIASGTVSISGGAAAGDHTTHRIASFIPSQGSQ